MITLGILTLLTNAKCVILNVTDSFALYIFIGLGLVNNVETYTSPTRNIIKCR
jgi:hypothetical protein